MSRNAYITEAFKQFNALVEEDELITSEEMPIYDVGSEKMHDFLDTVGDDSDLAIIDLEAEAEEDLKQSYVGKVILDCNVCHSNIFIDKDEIVVDEDGNANIELECPYCMSNEGYTIIGQVEPYEEETEDEEIEPEDDIEIEEAPSEEVEETDLGESFSGPVDHLSTEKMREFIVNHTDLDYEHAAHLSRKELQDFIEDVDDWTEEDLKDLKEGLINDSEWVDQVKELGKAADKGSLSDKEFQDSVTLLDKQLDECGDPEKVEEGLELDGEPELRGVTELRHRDDKEGVKEIRGTDNTELSGTDDLHESIEDVSITTEDETMTMTTKEDGGVVIETSPIEEEVEIEHVEEEIPEETTLEPGDEFVAPIDDSEEQEIELNSEVDALEDEDIEALEEPEEIDVTDFDEESFDELGESYLREHYDNVIGFKTVNAKIFENSLIVEGVIRFESGSSKGTTFIFEATGKENNNVLFEGYNRQISRGKKTFKLNCSLVEGCIKPEKMAYNYVTKNELNESVRVNGTVKVNKQ